MNGSTEHRLNAAAMPSSDRPVRTGAAAVALLAAADELLAGGGPMICSPADMAEWLRERAALIAGADVTASPAPGTPGFAAGSNCRVV